MEKSRVISVLGVVAVGALLVALFYVMSRDVPESGAPLTAQVSSSMDKQNTSLKVEVLSEGTGPEIENGKTAFMYYRGSLDDGTIFDKNESGEGLAFLLGSGQVIEGWDLGVLGMKVGEKRRLTIPADLGYGSSGFPGVIPPNATLHFDVELRAIR